jgi:hypothetical protein
MLTIVPLSEFEQVSLPTCSRAPLLSSFSVSGQGQSELSSRGPAGGQATGSGLAGISDSAGGQTRGTKSKAARTRGTKVFMPRSVSADGTDR